MAQVVNNFKAYLGNEDLLQERQAKFNQQKQQEKPRKVANESTRSRYFTDGVRAPLLSDLVSGQSCRLDVVRPPKAVSMSGTGSSSSDSPGRRTIIPQISVEKENGQSFDKASLTSKSMKYLLPNGTLRSNDETPVTSRSVSDLSEFDIRWKKYRKERDARDVLYRNTYGGPQGKLRYHAITLPSISTLNHNSVPKVNKPKPNSKRKVSTKVTPQPKVHHIGTNESKAARSNSLDTMYEVGFLKVQKIKSQTGDIPNGQSDLFLNVRQPTDINIQTSTRRNSELRTERPLKYESVSPYCSRTYRRSSLVQNMMKYSLRDYRSVDAYKEYLENVKLKMEMQSDMTPRTDNDPTLLLFGRESRVLQSVIDVNTPNDVPGITTSSDNKSLVIEIKPTWNEVPTGVLEDGESDDMNSCPVNTPANDNNNQQL